MQHTVTNRICVTAIVTDGKQTFHLLFYFSINIFLELRWKGFREQVASFGADINCLSAAACCQVAAISQWDSNNSLPAGSSEPHVCLLITIFYMGALKNLVKMGISPPNPSALKSFHGTLTAFHSPYYDLERTSGSGSYLLLSNTLLTSTSKPTNIKEHWPQFCLYKITNSSGSRCLYPVVCTQNNLPLESWQFMSSFFIY